MMMVSSEARARFSARTLVLMGMLTALEVILSRFLSFSAWNMKIGFSFIPVAVAAMALGPLPAAVVGGLADLIGALLFPIGPYFPGFSLTAFLSGLVWGLFLYRRREFVLVLGAVAVNQLILSLLLNSLWISLLYGASYPALLLSRLAQTAILIPVQLLILPLLSRAMDAYFGRRKTE